MDVSPQLSDCKFYFIFICYSSKIISAPQQTRYFAARRDPFNGEVRQQRHAFLGQFDLAAAPNDSGRTEQTQLIYSEVSKFSSHTEIFYF